MKFLVDTQIWLWWFLSPKHINEKSKRFIADPENDIFFSAASSWEIAIKYALKKLRLPLPPPQYVPSRLIEQGMASLPIDHRHTLQSGELPNHHRDPFDRILIAQSQIEELPLLTGDKQFGKYDVELIWAAN